MNEYRVLHHSDGTSDKPELYDYEYVEGSILQVGSFDNQYMCVSIVRNDDSTYFHFKQAKWICTFDY